MLLELLLWEDPVVRDGPENMAVDEWIAREMEMPVLRFYRWQEGWGSLGYFIPVADLPEEPTMWVRRWTGGGIVDHRADVTYTLFVPRGLDLAEARGAESYRMIHAAIAETLTASGGTAILSTATSATPGGECFVKPVEFDILDASNQKIAGAGQRRSSRGLLHQGSVLSPGHFDPAALASCLANSVQRTELNPCPATVSNLVAARYGNPEWTHRR